MKKTQLSVNVNKLALIRNSRAQNTPDIFEVSRQILGWGAHGITVHPRPDERHITYEDVTRFSGFFKQYPSHEFNVEGYPSDTFLDLIDQSRPDQVTLVPDPPGALTSSFGWDLAANKDFLVNVVSKLKTMRCRVSLFVDPVVQSELDLLAINPDRVELYTYDYAHAAVRDRDAVIKGYVAVAEQMSALNIGVNAGHDLDLDNLSYFVETVPGVMEVSIGHALVCDALQLGLETTVKQYLDALA